MSIRIQAFNLSRKRLDERGARLRYCEFGGVVETLTRVSFAVSSPHKMQ
jgi:hypothetical protein